MKAIDFVVRDGAGGLQRGVVSDDANSHTIQAQAGQEISLNLRQTDLQGQVRSGNDLVVTLADGRVITIDNYFNDAGNPNRLFISSDGYLNEVAFVDTGSGELYAQFGPTEQWGKWSPSDDLIYLGRTDLAAAGLGDDEVSMFAAPLLGGGLLSGGAGLAAAGVGGAAIIGGLAGGGDGSNNGSGPADPFVDFADSSTEHGGDDRGPDVLEVTGGGEPGDKVVVQIGEETVETEIGEDGTFKAIFDGDDFPADGAYDAIVTVTTPDGDVVLDGPDFTIDTTPPDIAVTSGTKSVEDFFNGETFADGVTLTGTGEAGAAVTVTIAGIEQHTTVAEDGTWSASWDIGSLEGGEYTTDVIIWTSDAFGNTRTVTDMLVVDTVTNVTIQTDTIETDGIVNGVEIQDGVTLTGTGEAGSTVVVTFGTGSHSATVGADGNWSVDFAAGELPTGELTATATVVATDSFGNSSTTSGDVQIDTLVRDFAITSTTGGADGVINASEASDGFTVTGTTEVGASVSVTLNGVTHEATVAADGSWSVDFSASEIPSGEQTIVMSATSTDAAGNVKTLTQDVVIDTQTSVTVDTETVETDGIVNGVEIQDGVTLTGTTQAGSSVVVSFGSGTHEATVDAQGNWSVDFPMGELPTGEQSATVTAVATDSFGNSATSTGEVDIDTLVRDFSFTGSTGGADGVINIAEAADGFTMTGTTEPGSTVSVTMNGFTHEATVAANGSWSVDFAASEIPGGEQTVVMSATATDAAGNVDTITRDVEVDRDAGVLTISSTPVEGDDVVNESEASDGVTLTGTSNPGADVVVTLGNVSHTVVTNAAGNWSADFSASEVPAGDYIADIKATTVDPAGNPLEATDQVAVDTRVDNLSIDVGAVGGGDGVINAVERLASGGMEITGTTEAGSTSVVVNLNGVDVNATVDAAGNWTATFAASQLGEGTYDADAKVTATDAAGNVASVSGTIQVDTEVKPFSMQDGAGGSDGVLNAAEAATGIDLGGQVEPGSTVVVNFDGTDHPASVDASGNWSLTIPPSAIRGGTYDAAISVMATDPVGNVDTITDTLAIDTDAPDGPVLASYTRDGDGIRGISTEISPDDLAVHQVKGNGAIVEVDADQVDIDVLGETNFAFNSDVPDGSHLVITATDTAGNLNGTYVVLDDEAAATEVTLDASSLGDFNIGTLDLNFAEEGDLTLDEATLLALSDNSNELQINGGSDDTVTITGASAAGSEMRDGQTYDVYTLGDEGKLFIEEDVNVVVT